MTGGSGSGKSAYAESLLYSCEGIRYYIATMQIYDAEGEKKVERHRKLRAGKGFLTIESPMNVGKIQFVCAGESGQAQYRQEAERKAEADREYRGKAAEHCYWWQVKKLLAPDAADAAAGYIHPLYAEAIKRLPSLEYWLDEHLGE